MKQDEAMRLRCRVIRLERKVNSLTKEKATLKKELGTIQRVFTNSKSFKGVPPLKEWPLHYRIQSDPDKVFEWLKLYSLKHSIKPEDLSGKTRHGHIVAARHVAMWFLKNNSPYSFNKIGEIFNRDHSTVMHAANKVDNYISAGDKVIRFSLDMCELSASEIWPATND